MTLHWWMHWFWITRPAAVITQLLFIVTAVQTVPLPASTLHPQVQSNHNSRTPSAINWASENDRVSVNHQPTSVYAEHYKQTAVYESNPVWSSSPDIEEPFYPTTASSDHLLDRKQSTKNIPVTFKSISKHEFYTETYPVSHVDKSDYSSTKATEFSAIRNYVLQTDAEKPLAHTPNTVEGDSYTQVNVNLREKQSVEYPENLDHGSWKMEEPRALPLQVNTPAETIGNIVVTKRPFSLINSPNILDDDNKYNKDVNISEEQYQDNNNNNNISKVSFPNVSISNFSENYTVPNRKHKQRLVTRDLGNISEPVFPLLASSPENNSSMQGNSSLSSNVRTGKAIGHSHALIPESLNSKSEPISTNEKINSNNRSSHYGIEKINSNDDKTNLKENDTKNTGNQEKIDDLNPHTANSSTAVSNVKLPQQLPPIADSVLETAKTSSLESGSSKYASNKTSDRLSFNASSLLSSANQKESKPHTNSTSSKGSIANNTQESLGKNVHDEDNSTLLDRLENIASSDTVEAGSFNPVHVHESIGRSASFSTGDGITIIPTVEPVSRSRIAASPNDINHKGLDAASITGIALGIVVFAGLTGAVSFILYRRRYLNKPQTLNDKCSNPDSSGYIDDSTLRENSEEMYSLDNDSFLNSLEAMTIQNYWTDNETCWRQRDT